MRDIYHELIKHEPDFKNHSDDALVCAVDMPGAMSEYGKEYRRKQCTKGPDKGRTISNVLLGNDADEWLPAATGHSHYEQG